MRVGTLMLLAAMTASAGALAEAPPAKEQPPSTGARWDDSHMQSRYQETPRTKRPRITGESGYGALTSGTAQASKQVSEQIEFTSQRQWNEGPLSTGSVANAKAAESAAGASGSSPISRGSTLRSGAVRSGR
jgi:hypothetical protein